VIDASQRHLEVIVEDSQLSLAIGKKGQNVRLAAKLVGWRIDIKSEDEKRQEVESAMEAMTGGGTPVSVLIEHGLGEKLVDKLLDAGTSTVERLADMTPEQLAEIPGIGPKMTEKIQLAVQSYYSQFDENEAEPSYEAGLAVPVTAPLMGGSPIAPPLQPRAGGGEAPAAAQPAAVMPGLPVEGEDRDETEDAEGDYNSFDTMEEIDAEAPEASGKSAGEDSGHEGNNPDRG
jgi:N utilization substance protein A